MMRRPLAVPLIAIGLLIGAGGLYALLHRSAAPTAAAPLSASAIYDQAVAQVPKPVLPPKPSGATELAPRIVELHLPPGHFGANPAPSFRHQVPQIAGTTPGAASWQATVDTEQAAYEKRLQAEMDRISSEKAQSTAGSGEAPNWITTVLIPLIAAVGGLITALAALISAIRPHSTA